MRSKDQIWINITNALIQTTTETYKIGRTSYYDEVHLKVNKIIENIEESEYGSTYYQFTKLEQNRYPTYAELYKALSTLKEIKAFLLAVSGEDIEDINKLKDTIKELTHKLDQYSENEKTYLEIIKNMKTSSDFQFDVDILKNFSGNNLKLMHEAEATFSVGAYTACICVCRNILQEFIQNLCKQNSIKGGSLKDQIDQLKDKQVIKAKQHSQLIDVATLFGNRAAHPTTEVFTKEKASIVLNTLALLSKELAFFSSESSL